MDGDQALVRLERRLARERAARMEAEAIAEQETRALYDQKRRLELLGKVATASNLAATLDEALQVTLDTVCEFTGWPVGHVFLLDEAAESPTMASSRVWSRGAVDHQVFRQATDVARFPMGEGLPGRVMACAEAIWSADVVAESWYPRARAAEACGLHAAFAFPALIRSEVAAVFEFYADRPVAIDHDLLAIMAQIGEQLGRAIERWRTKQLLSAKNAELERLIDEAHTQRVAAEAANRAKSAFLAVTSHEIRTPLNAVLGLAEALRREDLTPRQKDLTDGIRQSGAMLLRLLNAVLDLSQVETGRADLKPSAFDLRETLETIARIWRSQAEDRQVRLSLQLDGLPDPCVLVSDPAKVEQTVVNLLANALKFSPDGGTVILQASRDGAGRVLIEVLDEGEGVPEADRERIFQAYEQTVAGRQAGGAGLGLAICAGHVAVLNGSLGVDPRAGGGSRFWFDFQAGEASPHPVQPVAPEPDLPTEIRVLAAEDNPANRQVLELLLEPAGVTLVMAEDGAQALEAMAREHFDLVLMDANMPVMDGVTAVRAIRALDDARSGVPIFMVTANVFEDDVKGYMAAGADGVIPKPVDVGQLYAVLSQVFDGPDPTPALSAAS